MHSIHTYHKHGATTTQTELSQECKEQQTADIISTAPHHKHLHHHEFLGPNEEDKRIANVCYLCTVEQCKGGHPQVAKALPESSQ